MQDDARCTRHSFEVSQNECRNCGHAFCNECLVYAFGPSKPPYCVACALAAAGVRSNAGNRPAYSRREMRRRQKEQRKQLREQKVAAAALDAGPQIDWSLPEGSSSEDFDWADDPIDDHQPNGQVVSF